MNFIEEITLETDGEKINDYQTSKKYFMLAANCLAIITQLLQMTINEIMMLLCRTMLLRQNIDKFLLRYKEFYFKITTILNQLE